MTIRNSMQLCGYFLSVLNLIVRNRRMECAWMSLQDAVGELFLNGNMYSKGALLFKEQCTLAVYISILFTYSEKNNILTQAEFASV